MIQTPKNWRLLASDEPIVLGDLWYPGSGNGSSQLKNWSETAESAVGLCPLEYLVIRRLKK
jgi:hypothetical protein